MPNDKTSSVTLPKHIVLKIISQGGRDVRIALKVTPGRLRIPKLRLKVPTQNDRDKYGNVSFGIHENISFRYLCTQHSACWVSINFEIFNGSRGRYHVRRYIRCSAGVWRPESEFDFEYYI